MNHQTVTLVRSSWQQVESIAPAAAARLGGDFTPPLRAAWREVYGTIAEVMLCAAHGSGDAQGPVATAAPGVMRHEGG